MSLQRVVAAPFRQRGRRRLEESEFVVALSLDRDWFSPDQASRVADLAVSQGLLRRDADDLLPEFDPDTIDIPAGFAPDEAMLQGPSPFERILDRLIEAGSSKQEAVAGINRLQADLGITVEAAAVVFAKRQSVDVELEADAAMADL